MLLVIVIVLAAVLLVSAVILWIVLAKRTAQFEAAQTALNAQNQQIARMEATNRHLQDNNQQITDSLEQSQEDRDRLHDHAAKLLAEIATLNATLESERKNSQKERALLNEVREKFSSEFKSLASDILEEKSKRFTEQNQANLGNLITPLKEKFGEFQSKVESLEKDSIAGRSELKTQIEQLRSLNDRLSQDAANLVTALRGSSQAQGAWGEYVLENILESCGLRKGHEYRVQESFTREDRTRAKPDVILDLPEERHLVIDSKLSLNDYNDYCNNTQETLREAALARHMASVRGHIRELSQRNYQSLYALNSLDFVIMFVPVEPAFMLALARDGKLWHEAWERNVLLVGPSTLLFVLRTVAHLWRQEQQKKNVQEIVRRGSELYDKLAAFAKDLTDVGRKLDDARGAYDEAYKKLAEGKGNVIRQAQMLKHLGIKPTKSLPSAMIDLAMAGEPGDLFEEPSDETESPLELTASPDQVVADQNHD
jgi:DNA recombination protein RmuC